MGLLVDGQWQDRWYDTDSSGGHFQREESSFRHWVTADGQSGPNGQTGFAAESGRYHLYASYACPWAHRVLIYRALKGLESHINVSFVHWYMGDRGWSFEQTLPDTLTLDNTRAGRCTGDEARVVGDRLMSKRYLHEIYQAAESRFTGRVTVPALWDTRTHTLVSNESSELIRMLDQAFDGLGATPGNHCPADYQEEIEAINARVYDTVNNGVYKAGFATSQAAYEAAVEPLFETLDWLEARLAKRRFLLGDTPLEPDWRLWPTLFRFDAIYHGHFKCNLKRIVDYPHLWGYTRELYQWPGIKGTCNLNHARLHYHTSHQSVNPNRLLPVGPELDFTAPPGREHLG